jgi:hypothetical protein
LERITVQYTDNEHLHAFHSYKVHGPFLRKIRLVESNTKYRYIKKLTFKGTLRQVFYLSEAPSPPMTPHPPPLHTVYVYKVILIHTVKGGGGTNQRKGQRGNSRIE